MSTIWRLHIKPDADTNVDPRDFCFKKRILGIGWQVDADGSMDWDIYRRLAPKFVVLVSQRNVKKMETTVKINLFQQKRIGLLTYCYLALLDIIGTKE